MSTTHVDLQNERMMRSALMSAARQIRSTIKPILIDHDYEQQIGILLDARVHRLSDGEYGLFGLGVVLESEDEPLDHLNGTKNSFWQHFAFLLDEIPSNKLLVDMSAPILPPQPVLADDDNVAARLEQFIDTTAIWVDGRVYKVKHLIASTGDLSVHVYKDHPPPHFHVKSKQRKLDVRFSLETLEPLEKEGMARRDVKKIKAFFQSNPESLQYLRDEHARMQSQTGA